MDHLLLAAYLAGCALVAVGAGLVALPAGIVVGGALLAGSALLAARDDDTPEAEE